MGFGMRTREAVSIGEDVTPPLPPLACSLYDSSLQTHCFSCFRGFSSDVPITDHASSSFVSYCSDQCAAADFPLHISSGENSLFLLIRLNNSPVPIWPYGDWADLRASLRLLHRLEILSILPPPPIPDRIAGFMTNREKLTDAKEDPENSARIRDGARLMAKARAMRDGRVFSGESEIEEAVLCLILTNAVEVQDGVAGLGIGVGVYDNRFSWINHSCSPTCCYRFELVSDDDSVGGGEKNGGVSVSRITPLNCGGIQVQGEEGDYLLLQLSNVDGCRNLGPRMTVRSIKTMKEGEEVTVTYIDLLQAVMGRRSELWDKYKFICQCRRCTSIPPPYVDNALQETFSTKLHTTTTSLTNSRNAAGVVEKLRDYFDEVTSEFMLTEDAETCCAKIENVISLGHISGGSESESKEEGSSLLEFRLSPLHLLSLTAYTTLSSAYEICAAISENEAGKKISAAGYSLLRAGAVHHLFRSEPSLIVSTATFWSGAGESLLLLARCSSIWDSSKKWLAGGNSLTGPNCSCVVDCLEVGGQEEFENRCDAMHKCISSIISESRVWVFLARDCSFFRGIMDPVDFHWVRSLRDMNVWPYHSDMTHSELRSGNRNQVGSSNCKRLLADVDDDEEEEIRMSVFQLGSHCLVFGGYLSGVCYGLNSSRIDYLKHMLVGSE